MRKNLLKTFYKLGVFAPFRWINRDRVLILTYHRFSAEKNPSKISAGEFTAHLEYLKKNNQVLSLSEAVENLQSEKSISNAAVITIDDGYADSYEVAFPILKKFGFPATVYAVTDFLDGKCWVWTDLMRYVLSKTEVNSLEINFDGQDEVKAVLNTKAQRSETAASLNTRLKKLPNEEKKNKINEIAEQLAVEIPTLPPKEFAPINWEQAQEMDAHGVKVESHTVTHPILTNIPVEDLSFELGDSKKRVENALKKQVGNFCYPNGSLNEIVWKTVESLGYSSAVTTRYGFNEKSANRFLLKRIDAQPAIENFAQSVSGFEAMRRKS